MRRAVAFTALALVVLSCSGDNGPSSDRDDRLVVFGPSLVDMFCRLGGHHRIVGMDRYSSWRVDAPRPTDVGGYLDPNLEAVAALSPTSIHTVGHNRTLQDLCEELGVPYYHYSFDRLDDVIASAESLCSRYGLAADTFKIELYRTLDSLRESGEGVRAMLVVDHLPGTSTVTLAGRKTFLGDLVEAVGSELAAPESGAYPRLSIEGVLDLEPERILYLAPSVSDTAAFRRSVKQQWSSVGFPSAHVRCLFQDYLLVPGARLGATAREIVRCLRS
ncbi:ABC transporter substrate-binding protein [Candidatus Fermentibacteria bacterium]|nr:ABC transporter substrate-binding protein [Candidatus Fermentibacteria bacterium]